MDDFPGLLARDFGFRPQQGKSAPMSASKSSSSLGSGSGYAPGRSANPISAFDDVFGGPHKHHPAQNQNTDPRPPPPSFESILDGFKDPSPNPKWSSMPVFDKPVYDDDDIFEGVPGVKVPAKAEYDDVFSSISKGGHIDESGAYDDLLGGLGRSSSSRAAAESKRSDDLGGFEELIPGFGGSSPPSRRDPQEANQQKSSVPSAKSSATMPDDPFVVLETTSASTYPSSGMFGDPLEHLGRPMNSGSVNIDVSPASGGILDDIDAFDGLSKSVPIFAFEKNETRKDGSPPKSGQNRASMESFDNCIPKTQSTKSFDSRNAVQSSQSSDGPYERNATADLSPKSSEHVETADDVWLTVAEIPLFTQPTSAPPPSRPPPPLVLKSAKYGKANPRRKDDDSYAQSRTGYPCPKDSMRRPGASPTDEFEDFVMNKPQSNEHADNISSEDDFENNSAAAASAAAMKDAMDKAEAKFKHAKEVRERERDAKSARSGDFAQERDEDLAPDTQEWEDKKKQEKMDRENRERLQREREEREKEQRRLEKEREARQAVERATREARERAAVEARERAAAEARSKAERQAVEKANAEARQRAERAAVHRAQQEARERAAAEAKEKAARVAVERAAAEARQRAERAAVEKANAQARERAAAEAREKAAKERQVKTENDLESFFTTTNRPTSAPKERENRNPFEAQPQNRTSTDGLKRTTSTYSSTVKKTASTPNMVDDLASIFGGVSSSSGGFPSSSGVFQEVEGEPEERRRSRLEKHQRTLERAAKALAEKNERDMQVQREQAERHRIAETLDAEIKRWAAGKEGNLRALLSTLHYVLWPECGWQPVSLTDLIEGSKVKKIYRKATLCIHPDKVQQKGANIQQKYIAEKVFDLLKEAWNKFNSEELF